MCVVTESGGDGRYLRSRKLAVKIKRKNAELENGTVGNVGSRVEMGWEIQVLPLPTNTVAVVDSFEQKTDLSLSLSLSLIR